MGLSNIAILGDAGTGKTASILRLLYDRFEPRYHRTASPNRYEYTIPHTAQIVGLWDTPGSPKFPNMFDHFLTQTALDGALIFFDHSNLDSYHSILEWIRKIRELHPDIPIHVIGNKADTPGNWNATADILQKILPTNVELSFSASAKEHPGVFKHALLQLIE